MARISRGKVALRRERIELAALVANAVEMASPLLEERQHILKLEVPQEGLAFDADRQRMGQVIANLLTNAAKYSDPGSTITVRGRNEGGEVVLDVSDTGRGIAPDLLARLFDMFYQDPQSLSRSQGALGLGLAIVRSLTELHGGQRLGRQRRAAPGLDLHRAGPGTGCAGSGRRLDSAWPDIAILDIGLPGMDGYELAGRIRQLAAARGSEIRLVALSGYGQDSDARRALAAGFDRHIAKPVSLGTLQELFLTLAGTARLS